MSAHVVVSGYSRTEAHQDLTSFMIHII